MAQYPTGEWYKNYLEKYEETTYKNFINDIIMAGEIKKDYIFDYKKHYDDMLASGMFFEWNPTLSGDWESDMHKWIEKWGNGVQAEELKIAVKPMSYYEEELEDVIKRLEDVIAALETAIERGNDLHLGIVVGQTLTQLKDIARN